MKNIKPLVFSDLSTDGTLLALLGGKHVYNMYAPDSTVFPRIVITEYENVGATYSDDAETESEIYYQVDVVTSNASTENIAKQVDELMRGIGFFRVSCNDQYDDNSSTQVFEKHMRYAIYVNTEDD